MKVTEKPWVAERGFRDAFGPGGHYTIDDDYITVFCGKEANREFDPDVHDFILVYGPNQEQNAEALTHLPGILRALQGDRPDDSRDLQPLGFLNWLVAEAATRGPAPNHPDPEAWQRCLGILGTMCRRLNRLLPEKPKKPRRKK